MPRKKIPANLPRTERTEALRKRSVAASLRLPLHNPLYRHPKRKLFEEALLGGESVNAVAKRFRLDARNLNKYKSAYLAPLLNAARMAKNESELERAMNFDSVRDRACRLAYEAAQGAIADRLWADAALVLDKHVALLDLIGRAEKRIADGNAPPPAPPNAALQLGLIIAAPKYEEVYGPRSITEPPSLSLEATPVATPPVPALPSAPTSLSRPSGDK